MDVPSSRKVSTILESHLVLLHMLGVTFSFSMSVRDSYLVINATTITNGSIVHCEVEDKENRLNANFSSPMTTILYSKSLSYGLQTSRRIHYI